MRETQLIEKMDKIIQTAKETIVKADEVGSDWLSRAAQKEIIWARSEKRKILENMMRGNEKY